MDIRQRVRDYVLQEKTGVTAEDVEALAVEQCVARLSADEWRDLQEACHAMEEALKALYAGGPLTDDDPHQRHGCG